MSSRLSELSRIIALAHEPEPTWNQDHWLGRDHLSDGGWWWCEKGSIGDRFQRNHAREITEAEIAMRLLKEILVDQQVTMWTAQIGICITVQEGKFKWQAANATTVEFAIAEAWVKMKGLEGK